MTTIRYILHLYKTNVYNKIQTRAAKKLFIMAQVLLFVFPIMGLLHQLNIFSWYAFPWCFIPMYLLWCTWCDFVLVQSEIQDQIDELNFIDTLNRDM